MIAASLRSTSVRVGSLVLNLWVGRQNPFGYFPDTGKELLHSLTAILQIGVRGDA